MNIQLTPEEQARRYQLDHIFGEPGTFTLAEFIEHNPEFDDLDESAPIRHLQLGEAASFGGGAQPVWTIRRVE
jgi:hypothetical protein